MSLDDKLRAVKTLDDLRSVLAEAHTKPPRVIDFNNFMREQFEADRLVAEHFPGMNTTKVMSRFGQLHPRFSTIVDAVNLATHPQLVLFVARIVMSDSQGVHLFNVGRNTMNHEDNHDT